MWVDFYALSLAHFAAGRYEEARSWARRSIQQRPEFPLPYAVLAASQTLLGRLEDAQATVSDLARIQPSFSVAGLRQFYGSPEPDWFKRLSDSLRKAGLKE